MVHVFPHLRVGAVRVLQQFVVCALLCQSTIVNDVNLVHIDDGGKPMCTVDDSLAAHDLSKLTHDGFLSIGVQVTCCFVEQENLRFRFE